MNSSIVSLIVGAATAIISGLIGAWAGARLSFRYQQKLLDQQLDFQKNSQEQTELFIKKVIEDMSASLATIARRSPGGIGDPETNPAAGHKPSTP